MAAVPPLVGEVVSFDVAAGYGSIRALSDGVEHYFHCTALADGSREVSVGARVAFVVVPGAPGRWEAAGVVKL